MKSKKINSNHFHKMMQQKLSIMIRPRKMIFKIQRSGINRRQKKCKYNQWNNNNNSKLKLKIKSFRSRSGRMQEKLLKLFNNLEQD